MTSRASLLPTLLITFACVATPTHADDPFQKDEVDAAIKLGIDFLVSLSLGHDVQFPAGELGCEAYVLPAASDRL